MLTVLFLSIRSAKLKKQVERRLHTALCSGYKYLSFHTSPPLSTSLSLYHLDSCKGFCFFSFCTYVDFAAGAFVLRQSESGWKAGENIVYWLIVCSFVRSFVRRAKNARGHIIRYNLRALCTKVEWQAQQDYCLFYDTWPGTASSSARKKQLEWICYAKGADTRKDPKPLLIMPISTQAGHGKGSGREWARVRGGPSTVLIIFC